jgi:hypothetical protein
MYSPSFQRVAHPLIHLLIHPLIHLLIHPLIHLPVIYNMMKWGCCQDALPASRLFFAPPPPSPRLSLFYLNFTGSHSAFYIGAIR